MHSKPSFSFWFSQNLDAISLTGHSEWTIISACLGYFLRIKWKRFFLFVCFLVQGGLFFSVVCPRGHVWIFEKEWECFLFLLFLYYRREWCQHRLKFFSNSTVSHPLFPQHTDHKIGGWWENLLPLPLRSPACLCKSAFVKATGPSMLTQASMLHVIHLASIVWMVLTSFVRCNLTSFKRKRGFSVFWLFAFILFTYFNHFHTKNQVFQTQRLFVLASSFRTRSIFTRSCENVIEDLMFVKHFSQQYEIGFTMTEWAFLVWETIRQSV